ncbi:hypothetical protein B0H13DRAFT_2145763 [Mycena leptocephala]|nr:hypothetical protein B0H13DRAFT_2145763 [Mycena leptocephala]
MRGGAWYSYSKEAFPRHFNRRFALGVLLKIPQGWGAPNPSYNRVGKPTRVKSSHQHVHDVFKIHSTNTSRGRFVPQLRSLYPHSRQLRPIARTAHRVVHWCVIVLQCSGRMRAHLARTSIPAERCRVTATCLAGARRYQFRGVGIRMGRIG